MIVTEIPEFGVREGGIEYRLRPGGYVVLRSDAGEVAVIRTPKGLFLPGGGLEHGEAAEEAAVRETLEETGLRVRLGPLVGIADELVFGAAERAFFRKRCSFFHATGPTPAGPPPRDHDVLWLDPRDAALRLSHGSQQWAVRRAGANGGTAAP